MGLLIDPDDCVLVIIDVQADFLARVEDETKDGLLERIAFLALGARVCGIPIVASVESSLGGAAMTGSKRLWVPVVAAVVLGALIGPAGAAEMVSEPRAVEYSVTLSGASFVPTNDDLGYVRGVRQEFADRHRHMAVAGNDSASVGHGIARLQCVPEGID